MIVLNALGERYAWVSESGEATITEDGAYHVIHRALYEDRYVRVSFNGLLDILRKLDRLVDGA